MSREILYRGKRVDNGEWVYGYYLPWHAVTDLQGNEPYAQIFEEHKVKGKYVTKGWAKVKFNTVGEYTGLTDKNGKKIFEGDIVKRSTAPLKDEVLSIFYNGTHACYAMKSNYGCIYEPISDFGAIEVIGNIHDNSELIEVEEC